MTATIAERLIGRDLPPVRLPATNGTNIALDQLTGCTVIYIFPRTRPPGSTAIPGWDEIPGAKGCTPQSCGFRDHFGDLKQAGVDAVYGLSVQDSDFQRELVERLRLPFPLLSDDALALPRTLGLPTFEAGGMVLLQRMTLIVSDSTIRNVFHPITNPDQNAADVAAWLVRRAG